MYHCRLPWSGTSQKTAGLVLGTCGHVRRWTIFYRVIVIRGHTPMTIIVNKYNSMTVTVIFLIFLMGYMTIRSTDDCQSHMRVKIGYDFGVIFIIDFMTATVMTAYDSIESTFSFLWQRSSLFFVLGPTISWEVNFFRAPFTTTFREDCNTKLLNQIFIFNSTKH